jgi:hypothetical protein
VNICAMPGAVPVAPSVQLHLPSQLPAVSEVTWSAARDQVAGLSVPPIAFGCSWSTVVAGVPHQRQVKPSRARITRRRRRHRDP